MGRQNGSRGMLKPTHPTIIMAAGKGSRMKAQTSDDPAALQEAGSRPKAMIRIGPDQTPLLEVLLNRLVQEGSRCACVVISTTDEITPQHFRDHPVAHLHLSFVRQPIPKGRDKPLGTAHAVQLGLEAHPQWKGESVTVANGDNLPPKGLFSKLFQFPAALPAMDRDHLGLPAKRVEAFAVIAVDERQNPTDIIEKPSAQTVEDNRWPDGTIRVSMNTFRLPYEDLLDAVTHVPEHPKRREKELPTAVALWAKKTGLLQAIPMAGAFLDLTHPSDIHIASQSLQNGGHRLKN